jgi:hypothetical protein
MSISLARPLGFRFRRSIVCGVALLVVSAAPTLADGWKFWESKETQRDDGVGGMPYANSAKSRSRSTGFTPSNTSTSSGGWNIGAGMSSAGKSLVNGTTDVMSKTASTTKKVAKKTVDLVTLKPLRTKPVENPYKLGSHADPRAAKNDKPALWGSANKTTKVTPRTPSEFFSQKPVR